MENNSLLLCETASVSELTSRAVRAVVNGDIDPITAHINISRMEAAIKAFKDNEEIRDITLRELSKYGKLHQFGGLPVGRSRGRCQIRLCELR